MQYSYDLIVNLFGKAFAHVRNRLLIKKMSYVPLHQYISKNQIEDGKKTLTDSTRKKKDNSAKYNKTRVCIGASLIAKGYDLGPPSLQKKKGDPNRNPWLAKMP